MNLPYPYESLEGICATVFGEGGSYYRLTGKKTYAKKDEIKSLGGVWRHDISSWIISRDAVKVIKPLIMIRVRIGEYCHERSKTVLATHKEVFYGYMGMGCSLCDSTALSGQPAKIIEILDNNGLELAREIYG